MIGVLEDDKKITLFRYLPFVGLFSPDRRAVIALDTDT